MSRRRNRAVLLAGQVARHRAAAHHGDEGPVLVLAPGRRERRRALIGRVLRTAAQVASPSSAAGDAPGAGEPPVRAAFATKLLTSHRSVWSVASMWSAASLYSAWSAGSVLSLASGGSVLSIGSVGSILSIGSAGSILSIGSAGAVGGVGQLGRGPAPTPTAEDPALRRLATTLAVASLAAAALGRGSVGSTA